MKWEKRTLGEVADLCLGKMLDQKKNRGEFLPYLANINVRWGEFDLGDLRQMRFEQNERDRYGLKYGDIVMCEGGEPGRCAIWKEHVPQMMIQKALHRIRPHSNINYQFLCYSLIEKGKKGAFASLFTGSTIKHLPRQNLVKVEVDVPPLEIQERIGSILSAYDDLIENNTRRIQLLEESARLLYREWFVRLRFPGHEHARVVGGVPEGWENNFLPDIIDVNPSSFVEKGKEIKYVPMSSLSEKNMTARTIDFELRTAHTSVKFRKNDVLLARITPCLENGKTALAYFLEEDEVACGSTEFIVLRGKRVGYAFTYCLARSYPFRENAIKSMIGSSGRQRVQTSCFEDYCVLLPPKYLLEMFEGIANENFEQIRTLEAQNSKLAAARDLLLPRLMNGEIEV